MTEWGCFRMSESALKGDTSGPSLVENYCTMSSLLMPISFVPKLKTSDERGRERSTSPPHGTPPATLERFITSNLTIASKHSGKESRCGHTTVQTRKVGHREDEGLAQRGDAPRCLGCIPGSDTLAHTATDLGDRLHHNQNPGGSQLAVHNPSSVLYFTQLVLHYFPTVSRKIPHTNQMHGKQTAAKPFSFD